ncbi:MAG: hypothetical protein PHH01_00665 [Patescibacteria group bacterium]|nr:hypothetical protein [Patescibacteria group bacterium]
MSSWVQIPPSPPSFTFSEIERCCLGAKRLGMVFFRNFEGIFEYILGGSIDTKLLEVRVFDEATKKAVYATQTAKAEKKGESNCSHCAIGHDANKAKIWSLSEMDADHVSARSKGVKSDIKNC